MCVAKQLDYMNMSMKLYAMVICNRKYRYVIGRANLRFGDLLLACNRCLRESLFLRTSVCVIKEESLFLKSF